MTVATFTHSLEIDPAPYVRRDDRGSARLELAVKGMRCSGCIAKIERGLKALPGVEDARVNLSSAKVSVRWRDKRTNAGAIMRRIGELGFQAFPYDPAAILNREDEEGRFLLRCLAVAGFAASNVMFLSISIWSGLDGEMGEATRSLFHWLSGLVAFPAAVYAGRPFFYSAFESLRRGQANMDVPISIAIALALALSVWETVHGGRYAYFDAAVSLPFLLLIGRYLDHLLRRKAHETARDLIAMQTATATRLDANGATSVIAPGDVAPGDRLLIAPGERLPVDAVVEQGDSEADLSLVTGETASVRIHKGAALSAGALIVGQAIVIRASARAQDSLVAEIARLMEAGQQNRNRYVRWADRAARLYVPSVHGAALAVFVGGILFGVDAGAALTNAIALLIITCPCALGLAVPAVQIAATSRLFKRGLLVKSGDALERLAEADTVVFDKTGTLTRGVPVLSTSSPIDRLMLKRAARLARASRHPFARAIAEAAGDGPLANNVREFAGQGLEGEVDACQARLGQATWVGVHEAEGASSSVWYREEGLGPTRFAFTDEVRADAHATVARLKDRGLSVQMLSGDRNVPVSAVAFECQIEDWLAATGPTEKVEHLDRLASDGHQILMVGDGLNDAAALAAAHVSISPATGSNVSQAAADMVLTTDKLSPIVDAIDVARAARRLVLQNFAFAALYNVLAVPLAATGQVTPLIAAIAMSASSIVVMLNASRLAAKD